MVDLDKTIVLVVLNCLSHVAITGLPFGKQIHAMVPLWVAHGVYLFDKEIHCQFPRMALCEICHLEKDD